MPSVFFSRWKDAIVVLIFKKGSVYDPINYRLIALLCTMPQFIVAKRPLPQEIENFKLQRL